MSERKLRQWRIHRTRDPVGDAAVGGLAIGVVLVALALLADWTVLRFAGVLH